VYVKDIRYNENRKIIKFVLQEIDVTFDAISIKSLYFDPVIPYSSRTLGYSRMKLTTRYGRIIWNLFAIHFMPIG